MNKQQKGRKKMTRERPTLNYEQFLAIHIQVEQLLSADTSQMTEQECRSHLHKIKRLLDAVKEPA
jgi:chloramphenicol 3-O-phosphotransferase